MDELYKPQLVFYSGATLLEGPCWNKKTKEIVCVSIEQKCIYCMNLQNGSIRTFETEGQVGCVAIENEEYMLVAEYGGIYRLHIKTGKRQFLVQLNAKPMLRYNDGILDSAGRFLVGTTGYNCLAEKQNALFSWDGKCVRTLVDDVTISNGIAFSEDDKYMFYVDSPTRKVARYCYDIDSGNVSFDKNIINIDDEGMPDGICIDDNTLWIAHWGGGKVSRWNISNGQKIMEIPFPCKNVSSCCLGGEDNEYLFVTTARHDDGTKSEDLAGGLFRIKIKEGRDTYNE